MTEFDLTIAGEVNLDLILYGLDADIPLDRETLANGFEMTLGSSSAILAHNISLLGAGVGFVTRFGDDEMGRIAMQRLAETRIDLSRCRATANAKTGVSVLLPHGRSRRILTFPGVMFEMSVADLDFAYLCLARHFHLSSLFLQKGLHRGLPDLFRALKLRGLTLSLDTNDDPEGCWGAPLGEILPLIDIFLPNEDEICRIARKPTVEQALDELALVPTIAVKCGAQGAIVQQGSQRFRVPGIPVEPVDTIGAGDSFNAGFLAAWLRGADSETCARAGNIAGALSTQRPGGTEAFRNRDLRESFLRDRGFPF
ncbi:MAG TPA: carbohydrate kinase family protein [Terracidiphilus sp.]|nr:carbohydrate kinase family protein [Terracidiphilus sp.]